jgi:hypothetical protein
MMVSSDLASRCLTPVELCAVSPDAVQDHGKLAGHRDRGLLAPDAFDQLGCPGLSAAMDDEPH